MVVSPQNCFKLCTAYFRPLGIEFFFFQIYNNGTHENCGCCEDCETPTPAPPNSIIFEVYDATNFPTPSPSPPVRRSRPCMLQRPGMLGLSSIVDQRDVRSVN